MTKVSVWLSIKMRKKNATVYESPNPSPQKSPSQIWIKNIPYTFKVWTNKIQLFPIDNSNWNKCWWAGEFHYFEKENSISTLKEVFEELCK